MPRAQPAQVDILHKQKYTHNLQEQVQWQIFVFASGCPLHRVFFPETGIFSSFHYSNTLFCVFSLPLISTRLFRQGADITHLLVTRRQMEKDYGASSIFIQRPRPFSSGKLSPLLETQHKGSKTDHLAKQLSHKQTHTEWLYSNYSIHQERVLNMGAKGNTWGRKLALNNALFQHQNTHTHTEGCNVICQTGPIMLLYINYFTAWWEKHLAFYSLC